MTAMAARIPGIGLARAACRPSRKERSRLISSAEAGGGPSRTNKSAATTARNETAFRLEGHRVTERCHRAAGERRTDHGDRVELAELSEAAARNSLRGTRSGRMAC